MRSMKAHLWMLTILAACGGGGGDDANSPDAPKEFLDAPPVVPAMISISGVAEEQAQSGSTPLTGVAIALFRRGNDTPLASATTDAQGKYSVMIATGTQPVDGYVKATKTGYVDSYAYPPAAWIADSTRGDANMITTGTFNLLVQFGGGSPAKGVVTLAVVDAADQAVTGATVSSTPASGVYKYSDANGFPTSTTGTAADGIAFMLDVPAGDITVKATKAGGAAFKSHVIEARAGKFTTTAITQ
jgi:hypothetical protein